MGKEREGKRGKGKGRGRGICLLLNLGLATPLSSNVRIDGGAVILRQVESKSTTEYTT